MVNSILKYFPYFRRVYKLFGLIYKKNILFIKFDGEYLSYLLLIILENSVFW